MKRIVAGLLAVAIVFGSGTVSPVAELTDGGVISVSAEDSEVFTYGDYEYIILDDGTIEINNYYGSEEELTIPSTIDGKKVTSIGDFAFHSLENFTSITIPNSVTNIGVSAFNSCTSLTSIIIPNSVISIGSGAFEGTEWLENKQKENSLVVVNGILINGTTCSGSVVIPDGVKSIGDGAFLGCDSLKSISIPGSVTSICNEAFLGCGSLKSITIQDGVTIIGKYAFSSCYSLTSIEIPDSVTSIGDYAFEYCENLAYVKLPNKITKLGWHIFDGTLWLLEKPENNLLVDNGILIYADIDNCTGDYAIPDNVTIIGGGAFAFFYNMTSVKIPDSVTTIGDKAFVLLSPSDPDDGERDRIGIEYIRIPKSVVNIGEYSIGYYEKSNYYDKTWYEKYTDFKIYCYAGSAGEKYAIDNGFDYTLMVDNYDYKILDDGTVEIIKYTGDEDKAIVPSEIDGKKVTSIGESAFEGCEKLTSITIPNSVKSIGYSAFRECSSLTSITIPDSVTSIEDAAFFYCTGLTDITMPNSVISIGASAFSGCSGLTSITIPNSVTSIGMCAFYNCDSLTSIIIPRSVSIIDERAFGYYTSYNESIGWYEPTKKKDYKIYCYSNTAGEQYAKDNGFEYELLDKPVVNGTGTVNIKNTVNGLKVDNLSVDIGKEGSGKTDKTVKIASDGKFTVEGLADGNYDFTFKADKCVPRTYSVTVKNGLFQLDNVELHLCGDTNGDGKITTADIGRINADIRKTKAISDKYDFAVSDTNGDGKLTTADIGTINAHIRGTKNLW